MKLNVGSGADYREGWINVERFLSSTHHKGETETPEVVADAHYLPLASGSVEHVRLNHVLEHLDHPLTALREVYRVLEPGGTVYTEVPDPQRLDGDERPEHLYSWTKEPLKNIHRRVGFEVRYEKIRKAVHYVRATK